MNTQRYSELKDWLGIILASTGVVGLLYLLYVLPFAIFGVYFWTGMGMPQRTPGQYDPAVRGGLWSLFFWPVLPWVSACVALIWQGRRLRHQQRRLLEQSL